MQIIAAYKGDNHLTSGTVSEVAKYLGVKPDTVKFYLSPIYHKRKVNSKNPVLCYRLEDEENES